MRSFRGLVLGADPERLFVCCGVFLLLLLFACPITATGVMARLETEYVRVGKIFVSNMVLGTVHVLNSYRPFYVRLCVCSFGFFFHLRIFQNWYGLSHMLGFVCLCVCVGYGSHGTMVYAGLLEGRSVAVKRMLVPFFELAHGEIALLMESDTHPNVIRYFAKVRF